MRPSLQIPIQASSFLSSLSAFHLRFLPPPYCLHSFCPFEQGQIQSLPHSHFSHSFCQFWHPAFYPIPYSHCFPSLLFALLNCKWAGRVGVGGSGGKKSCLLLKDLWIFSSRLSNKLFISLFVFFVISSSHVANKDPVFHFWVYFVFLFLYVSPLLFFWVWAHSSPPPRPSTLPC